MIGGFFMSINDFFAKLNEELEEVKQQHAKGELSETEYHQALQKLQQKNEEVLDEWVSFEDKVSQLMDNNEHCPLFHSEHWNKAKACYDLMMFEQAAKHFEKVLDENSEYELARLYLAHSYLATQRSEQARYHLQFLLETSSDDSVKQLSAHALACIEGTVESYEQALHYFNKIELGKVKQEWKPMMLLNHAYTLFRLKKYDECSEKLKQYLNMAPNDWHGPYLLGHIEHELGNEDEGFSYWFEALQIEEDSKLLLALAKHFESKSYYQMAVQCYERILALDSYKLEPKAWSGLAWNLGLQLQKKKSEAIYLKALTLFPDQTDIQFSYVWMLLYWNEKERAKEAIDKLSENHSEHPLVQGLHYLYDGKFNQTIQLLSQ